MDVRNGRAIIYNGLTVSGSINTVTGSLTVTEGITGSLLGTASWALNVVGGGGGGGTPTLIANGSVTASVSLNDFTVRSGSSVELTVTGTGVNIGNVPSDVHTVTGSFIVPNITGSLQGTASFATNVATASLTGSFVTVDTVQNIVGAKTFTPAANTTPLSISGYSLTGANAQPALDISGTWNTTGTPTLIRANVTNTASNASSLLMDLQVGGVSRFRVNRDGDVSSGRINTDVVSANVSVSIGSASRTTNTVVFSNPASFNPTSGTTTFIGYGLTGTINQTGGANGITRGLFINPTLTAAADWRSIEWSNNTGWGLFGSGTASNWLRGRTIIGGATAVDNGTDALQVNGSVSSNVGFVSSNATANITLVNGTSDGQQVRLRMSGNNGVLDVTRNSGTAPNLILGTEATERMRITSGGNVLLGTTTDNGTDRLQVDGSGTFSGQVTIAGTTGNIVGNRNTLFLRNANATGNRSNAIVFGSADNTNTWVILNDHDAIGTQVNQLRILNNGNSRLTIDSSGNLTMAGDVTAFSDARVKENISTVGGALDKVTKLRGVYYNRIDSDDKRRKIGVIAQEVLDVIPEVVSQDNDGMYNVSYGNIVGVLIEAIKEQQAQIDELKSLLQNR